MHHLLAFALLGTVSASAVGEMVQARALMAMKDLTERQAICVPVPVGPNLCERSCGPGYITCISLPTCYNPSAGETCCSNGKYCPAGFYCTDAGCCPDGTPLAECGATVTLSVVPPPPASTAPPEETSSSPPEETSSAPPEETSSAPPEETSSAPPEETSSAPPVETYSPPVDTYSPPVETYSAPATETSAAPTTSAPPEYSQSANGTAPTSRPPPPVTAGAARLGTHIFAGLGGLGAALMAL